MRLLRALAGAHPIEAAKKSSKEAAENVRDHLPDPPKLESGKVRKKVKKTRKKLTNA